MRERMGSGGPRGLQIPRSGADRVRGGFDSHAFPPSLRVARTGGALLLGLTLALAVGAPAACAATAAAAKPVASATADSLARVAAARRAATADSLARAAEARRLAVEDSLAWAAKQRRLAVEDSLAADSILTHVQSGAADDSLRSAASGRPGGGPPADTTSAHRHATRKPTVWDQPRFVMLRSLVFPGWGQAHNRAWWKAGAVFAAEAVLIGRLVADEAKLKDLQKDIDAAQAAQDEAAYAEAVAAYNSVLDASVARTWLLGGVVAYAMLDAYVDAHFVDFDIQFQNDPALRGRPTGGRVQLGLRKRF